MIRPYSKVSFIYGASGLRYAKSIIKKLKLIHDEGGYPIITSIFASSIIDSGQQYLIRYQRCLKNPL